MGSPRKQRSRVESPTQPWDSRRIEREQRLLNEYGLKTKDELRRAESKLRSFRRQARKLASSEDEEEREELLGKLVRLNMIGEEGDLNDILALDVRDVLNRRLQTVVFKKGLANTVNQSRQFIAHGHVRVGDKRVTRPSFIVPEDLEDEIELEIEVPEGEE